MKLTFLRLTKKSNCKKTIFLANFAGKYLSVLCTVALWIHVIDLICKLQKTQSKEKQRTPLDLKCFGFFCKNFESMEGKKSVAGNDACAVTILGSRPNNNDDVSVLSTLLEKRKAKRKRAKVCLYFHGQPIKW